jgi:hypothetical protein
MNWKLVALIVSVVLAVTSLFFPYEVQEAEPNTYLTVVPNPGGEVKYLYYSGFDLGFPMLGIPVIVLIFILMGFVRTRATGILSIVFASLHVLWMPVVLFGIHFTLFYHPVIHTGIGYYMMLLAVLIQFIVPIMVLRQQDYKTKPIKRRSHDILDEIDTV